MIQTVFFHRGSLPPKSNAERQRLFRRNHPGYYRRLHASRRAMVKEFAAVQAEAAACAVSIPSLLDIVRAQPLMLPAPVELPIFAIPERVAVMVRPM